MKTYAMALAFSTALCSVSASADIVYENNFSSSVGSEWNTSVRSTTPIDSRTFLGEFSNDQAILKLNNLPNHSALRIDFDLFIIRSWDGVDTAVGPDIWSLSVDGKNILQTTFANFSECGAQNWPDQYPGPLHPIRTGASEINTLGYTHYDSDILVSPQVCETVPGPAPMDAVYNISVFVSHTANTSSISFSARGLQNIEDESWGITNLKISAEHAVPTNMNQCKNDGWKAFGFKNQGQCIQFVNTGK